jgi:hypothetical protein
MFSVFMAVWNLARNLRPRGWLVVALLAMVLLFLGTCTVQKITSHFERNDAVKSENADRGLREALSNDRQQTELAIIQKESELNEALDNLPDDTPSSRRLARACLELRNDGYVELPAACRPETNGTTSR